MEKENIGRPSTYALIIQTIQTRLYVEQKERRFFATDLGMIVTDLLVEHFPKIMDLKFTAKMEDELDEIASAKEEMVKVLDDFYHPFQDALKVAEKQMQKVQVLSSEVCHVCGAPMVVKFSKTGQFLGCSKYPECKSTRPMDGSGPSCGRRDRAHLSLVWQALDAPREQAGAVPVVLRLSLVQGVVQPERAGTAGPLGRRNRARLREVR